MDTGSNRIQEHYRISLKGTGPQSQGLKNISLKEGWRNKEDKSQEPGVPVTSLMNQYQGQITATGIKIKDKDTGPRSNRTTQGGGEGTREYEYEWSGLETTDGLRLHKVIHFQEEQSNSLKKRK